MMRNNDYFNLYFGGQIDTWNAKPPLLSWLIVLSYKLFGVSTFTMRLPAIICTLIYFQFVYKIFNLFTNNRKSLFFCLVLVCCRAGYGIHIGFTADFEALLHLFFIVALYIYLEKIQMGQFAKKWIIWLILGFGFWTKGPAILPIIFVFVMHMLMTQFKSLNWFYIIKATCLLLIGPFSWFLSAALFGASHKGGFYGQEGNVVETLIYHDTVRRISDPEFTNANYKWYQFFSSLNTLWNGLEYMIFASLLFIIYSRLKHKILLTPPLSFAILNFFVYGLLISVMQENHDWYVSPLGIAMIIVLYFGIQKMPKPNVAYALISCLIIINLYVTIFSKNWYHDDILFLKALPKNEELVLGPGYSQDLLFSAYIKNNKVKFTTSSSDQHVIYMKQKLTKEENMFFDENHFTKVSESKRFIYLRKS